MSGPHPFSGIEMVERMLVKPFSFPTFWAKAVGYAYQDLMEVFIHKLFLRLSTNIEHK